MNTDLHLLTGACALDAVPAEENAEFAAHLPDCPTCSAELTGFLETAAMLSSLTAEPAPPRLRETVLQAIRVTAQLPPLTVGPVARVAPTGPAVSGGPARTDESAAPLAEVVQLRPWYRRPQAYLAAAVAALVIGGGTVVAINNSNHGQNQAACISTAIDRTVLSPVKGAGNVVTSPSCAQAVVTVAGLPALPSDKVYQLWALQGAKATSMGVMATSGSGSLQPVTAPVAPGTMAFAVTIEPTGGSATPTLPIVWTVNAA